MRAEAQAKTVSTKTRKDVQMDVEDVLPSGFAISQEQVDPFTGQTAAAQREIHSLGGLKKARAYFWIQRGQVSGMLARHN